MPKVPLSSKRPKRLLPLWEGRALLIATGLGLTILIALLLIFPPLIVQQAELRLYDLMLSGRVSPPKSGVPVLLGIDDESIKAYGQWPWPRYRLAMLVERLHDAGAKVVAIDFLMPEFDRTSPEVIMSERRSDLQSDGNVSIKPFIDSNSILLARAMGKGETSLGFFFDFARDGESAEAHSPVVPAGMVVSRETGSDAAWPRPKGVIRSIPVLTGSVGAEGFTNAPHDRDGALRRVPLLLSYSGRQYPSLALSALLLSSTERRLHIVQDSTETMLVYGNHRIPLDREGNLLLDFRDEQDSFRYLSARSVLTEKKLPAELQGKIVLVGPWAKGLGDSHLVPSGRFISGLAIHATVIDNILADTFIGRPSWARGAELFAVLLLGVISTWLLSRPGFLLALATVGVGVVGSFWGGRWLLIANGLYISPFMSMITPVVVMTFLSLLKYGIEARKVRQRTHDLIEAQNTIINSMSALTEIRDKETGGHILRTQRYVEILARQLANLPHYSYLDENSIELLAKSAPLHDIGKVGIPDDILHKPGNFTEEEYDIMKSHTMIGVDALSRSMGDTVRLNQNDFLDYARQMIESHHERWDGSGYPYRLSGEEIPLAGRLMALADVYDALVSRRVYKRELSHESAVKLIQEGSGRQFDPDVVAAFIVRHEEFFRIAREFDDNVETGHAADA